MPYFLFEMVLMVVGPAEEYWREQIKMWAQELQRLSVNEKLDEAQGGLDYFSVRGLQVLKECQEDLFLHLLRDFVCEKSEIILQGRKKEANL